MEPAKKESPRKEPTKLSTEIRIAFASFSLFDIIHIVCAIILMFYAYSTSPIKEMDAAECGVELVFSVLLVSYTVGMVRRHKEVMVFRRFFSYAWLILSCACFCPLTFHLPEIVEGAWGESANTAVAMNLTVSGMIVGFFAVALFALSLLFESNPKAWRWLMVVAVSLMLVMSILCLVSVFFEGGTADLLTIRVIKHVAPFFPCVMAFIRLSNGSQKTELY